MSTMTTATSKIKKTRESGIPSGNAGEYLVDPSLQGSDTPAHAAQRRSQNRFW
jgi:hypothetical protein